MNSVKMYLGQALEISLVILSEVPSGILPVFIFVLRNQIETFWEFHHNSVTVLPGTDTNASTNLPDTCQDFSSNRI